MLHTPCQPHTIPHLSVNTFSNNPLCRERSWLIGPIGNTSQIWDIQTRRYSKAGFLKQCSCSEGVYEFIL